MVHKNFPAILSKMFQKYVVLTFLAIHFRKWTLMLDFKCNFLPRVMILKRNQNMIQNQLVEFYKLP